MSHRVVHINSQITVGNSLCAVPPSCVHCLSYCIVRTKLASVLVGADSICPKKVHLWYSSILVTFWWQKVTKKPARQKQKHSTVCSFPFTRRLKNQDLLQSSQDVRFVRTFVLAERHIGRSLPKYVTPVLVEALPPLP